MPLDHYVTLGRSGLRVSPLCLGAMTFGEDLGWGSSVEESQQILDRYIELGGNFIDTANFYTKSHSEKIIGDHIGRHPAQRDRLVIATKFSGNLYPGDPNGGGSGRKAIIVGVRELAAPPADRLHRSVLAAQLGQAHAHRGDDGRARRPRARGQGALPRRLRHAGVEGRRGQHDWRASAAGRRSSACRSSTRCSSAPWSRSSCRWRWSSGSASRPWSPLKSGALSGKYTRANAGQQKADRGRCSCEPYLNERTYAVVDALDGHRQGARDAPSRAWRSRGCRRSRA